ncbi:hypothetical protein [Parvicella tangerina]|uniref:DUF3240 domain-containing protein n=1 Tax=Parvicella tangerina TaxID=2829795 RepID=A0A916NFW8_9FLAO|nr:hypothetical protein [Parvicella tangerina]CAG5078777.1 hypothetical protein CRYO30217_00764 [Parvicella tangerina]
MVQVVLQDRSVKNLEQILSRLLNNQLVTSPTIVESQRYQPLKGGHFLKYKYYQLTAISRSIHSKEILDIVEELKNSNSLEFYTVPIVDMNWNQASNVKGYFDNVKMVS